MDIPDFVIYIFVLVSLCCRCWKGEWEDNQVLWLSVLMIYFYLSLLQMQSKRLTEDKRIPETKIPSTRCIRKIYFNLYAFNKK